MTQLHIRIIIVDDHAIVRKGIRALLSDVEDIEIIGEATKRISTKFRESNPSVPWSDMAGMRDVLIHDYIEVDFEIVWKTATVDLPKMKKLLARIS